MKVKDLISRREEILGRLLFIYQMPKVGSQTIEATLRQSSFPHPIHRFHFLSGAFAGTIQHGLASTKPDPAWRRDAQQQLDSIQAISRAIRLRKILRFCGFKIPKLEVITGVRELISLCLASVFENYLYFTHDLEAMTTSRCREALMHPKTFKTLKHWFNLELRPFIGVDVFQTHFPRRAGYAIYENRFARVLVYRFEAFQSLPCALNEFLGCDVSAMVTSNLGESKQYAERYRFVKEHLRLPADFVASLYDCKLMRHFYSDQERRNWQGRWSEPQAKELLALH
jgi:hypothetical protein